jgi:hypothetical protein
MRNWLARLLLVIRHAVALWRVLNLPKNKTKGGWRHIDPYDLCRLADRELVELKAAVWAWEGNSMPHNRQRGG